MGLDQLTDAGLSLVVRLKVWHRDRPELVDCPHLALRFVIDGDIAPAEATEDDVRLQCASDRQSIAPEPKAAPVVAVLGASDVAPDHPDWVAAERCGRHLATAGLVVTTGGYGGVMEAASKGAAEAGGHVVGVTAPPVFPYRPGANRWVIEERRAATLTERIDALLSTSSAVIVLPGSVGTLTELMVAWNLAQVAALAGEPPLNVVAVGDTWRNLVESLAARMGAGPALVTCVDSVEEAVDVVSTHLRGDG